ncbi:MAG: Hsp33 family molecular chaperone HslO [Burkholderiaceae bacterium]|jgi:molecular chaperone Hsp33|nr:Hsp33 family molecular chaperone HslO [Burkholderiaceae bacterium]MCU0966263.1 Hsp33 family molecular chaperone HslO [Burkholderiaceae bacterium]
MAELHRFMFDGLPVRGQLVRLGASWREMLSRRAHQPYAPPVRSLLGEMAAAGVLMQSNIKFNGTLLLQMYGDGPVKLAVAEVRSDLSFRATATVLGEVPAEARLEALLNLHGQGRCSITLDPTDRLPGQQPYQGVVPLHGDRREPLQQLAQVLEHYMLQSEQLDTRLVLAADEQMAAGLLIQRMPIEGPSRMSGERNEDQIGRNEDFNRIAHLTATLTRDELLTLDADTMLRRLYWEERLLRYEPRRPRFACSCARERVRNMLRGLGPEEVHSILAERGEVEVGCEFCGQRYHFDAVDVGEMFTPVRDQPHTRAPLQ